jgi:hypothetical protein
MSEIDQVKEEIGFYKMAWAAIIAILTGLIGWFALSSINDRTTGLALASIFALSILWILIQIKIFQLIKYLRNL